MQYVHGDTGIVESPTVFFFFRAFDDEAVRAKGIYETALACESWNRLLWAGDVEALGRAVQGGGGFALGGELWRHWQFSSLIFFLFSNPC